MAFGERGGGTTRETKLRFPPGFGRVHGSCPKNCAQERQIPLIYGLKIQLVYEYRAETEKTGSTRSEKKASSETPQLATSD